MSSKNHSKYIIVGSGIAGLTAAVKLKEQNLDYLILEKQNRIAGTWKSHKYKNSIIEFGPNTVLNKSSELEKLIQVAGLQDMTLSSELKKNKRYIFKGLSFHEVSSNPLQILFSKLISLEAKLKILQEPFIKKADIEDESVYDFFERRFGKEVAQYLIAPALQGVWGGDIKQLNMQACMSSIKELEEKHSSVIKGFLQKKKTKKQIKSLSFKNGLEELCLKLGTFLGIENFQFSQELVDVKKENNLFKVTTNAKENNVYYCEKLILACPSFASARALKNFNTKLSEALAKIYYAPIFLSAFSIKEKVSSDFFNAFGFLNSNQGHFTLGSIFCSSLFEERKLEEENTLLSFLGGAKNPQILDFNKAELEKIAQEELQEILQNKISTQFTCDLIHSELIERAIPQYNNDYWQAQKIISSELTKEPCLALIGNYLNGVSITDTIENSSKLTKKLIENRGAMIET